MNKVKRKELVEKANDHELRLFQIEKALEQHGINWFTEEPKLKVLDQSVFDGLDAKWRFAAVDGDGVVVLYIGKPSTKWHEERGMWCFHGFNGDTNRLRSGYCTINWQNSLIERDIAKELSLVDLSSELTGSDLTRSILSKQFMQACLVSDSSDKAARQGDDLQLIRMYNETDGKFISMRDPWHGCHHKYAVAVDNNRKPLTAADVGL